MKRVESFLETDCVTVTGEAVKAMKRDEQTKDMTFTQRDLIESFAKYMSGGCGGGAKMDPSAAGNFIRFMEAQKMANKTFAEADANGTPGVDSVAIVVNDGDSPPADCAPAAMPAAPAAGFERSGGSSERTRPLRHQHSERQYDLRYKRSARRNPNCFTWKKC